METDQAELTRAGSSSARCSRGKYRLDGVIYGMGGMAVVYWQGNSTAIRAGNSPSRCSTRSSPLNDNIRNRFLREGYAANSVKHSGQYVLVVDDDVAEDGAAFLAMRSLLNGLTADEAWTALGGRVPIDAACAIAIELLDVLAAAHEKGILHRDIKPANLFITREGALKVLDFGIARVRDSMAGSSQATGTGMLLGTPAFMAPEQVIGKPSDIDTRVDLWATGATMFNLLSGQMVHEAETGPQLMVKLATQPPRALHDVAPDAPPAIAAAVDRGLAFDKNLRWQTAGEMQAALRAACTTSFGDFNGRAILAKLVASAKPMAGRAGASPSSAQASPPASFGTPPPRTATAPGVRAITASPISTSSAVYQDPPASVPVTSRKGALAVIAGIGALAIAGLLVAVLHKGPSTAPAEGPAASAPPAPLPTAPKQRRPGRRKSRPRSPPPR